MTHDERLIYNKAINCLDYKVIGRPNVVAEPSIEQLNSMRLAVDALEQQMKTTEKDLSRHIAVINYHLANPTALLFKDRYTIDAMNAGVIAMKWLVGSSTDE
jgi:hypothetical protein